MNRNDKFLTGIELHRQRGMEIGALDKPIVPPETGSAFYVDHMTTEGLRQKYHSDRSVNVDRLVHVDGVWGEKTLLEIVGDSAPFDYIIASHVIEHVPDLITWLAELQSVLSKNGSIRLAIPDRRFSFDFTRRETELSDVMIAYWDKARTPGPRQALDYALHCGPVDCNRLWRKKLTHAEIVRTIDDRTAIDIAKKIYDTGEFVIDIHTWVFTPLSFVRLMKQMGSLSMHNFCCDTFWETEKDSLEFFVVMSTCRDNGHLVASWEKFESALVQSENLLRSILDQEITTLRDRVADAEAQIKSLKNELQTTEQDNINLRTSTSWKITAPLRRLRSISVRK